MKTLLTIFIILFALPIICYCQNTSPSNKSKPKNNSSKTVSIDSAGTSFLIDDSELYVYFPEGKDGPSSDRLLKQFITENIIYPDSARKHKIEGIVYVSFLIDQNGYVSDPVIIKSSNAIFNVEAKRLISIMPNWVWDKNIAMNYRKITKRILPLKFKLN